jgi:hypothetical protein
MSMAEKTQEQFDREIARARASLPAARAQLRGIPGVIDVLVGIKETGGMATQTVVFQVYVGKKKPLDQVAPDQRIPATIAGIPTDVIGREPIEPHDVLCGGMTMTQSLWGMSIGTLGAFGLATAANTHVAENTPVLLTNHHVASDVGDAVGLGCLCDSWCCECCAIGHLVDASLTNRVDGSIATLNAGVRFSHEILGIGPIRGSGLATMGMPIVKYGQTSGLTTGTVTQDNEPPFTRTDGATFVGQIRVAPVAPSTTMSEGGDSGSVYVDANTRRIVGLNHAGSEGLGFGNHIADVIALLNFSFPVMGTAGAIPVATALPQPDRPTMLEALALYRRELERTEVGQRWLELIRAHAAEVRYLVNHHRETQVAWHRSQGPGFIAHYVKSARDPDHRVPREIGGVRMENLIVSMAAVLQQQGSPELARAITEHYLTALHLARRADSAQAAMASARQIAGA